MASMRIRALALVPLLLAACDKVARVEMDPAALRFGVRGQTARVHATPISKNGQRIPDQICRWSSTDEKVATVSGPHNDGTVTAVGPGSAVARCTIGEISGDAQVLVRVVGKVVLKTARADLKMLDEPTPLQLDVAAFDDTGAPVQGRVALAHCASEDICRGDARGQLWAVGPGDSTAFVEVEGARSGEIPVHVVDARSADAKPKAVKVNPMLEIERQVRERDEAERKNPQQGAERKERQRLEWEQKKATMPRY